MKASLGSGYVPNNVMRPLGIFPEKMYCGRFSTSGDVLLTAGQDAVINLYDSERVYQWGSKGLGTLPLCLFTFAFCFELSLHLFSCHPLHPVLSSKASRRVASRYFRDVDCSPSQALLQYDRDQNVEFNPRDEAVPLTYVLGTWREILLSSSANVYAKLDLLCQEGVELS